MSLSLEMLPLNYAVAKQDVYLMSVTDLSQAL